MNQFTNHLYTLLSSTPQQYQIKLCDENHPIFQAHFPNFPILPGFLLIDIILEVTHYQPKVIKNAKFISHSYPHDILIYTVEEKNGIKKVKVTKKDLTKVGEFSYE